MTDLVQPVIHLSLILFKAPHVTSHHQFREFYAMLTGFTCSILPSGQKPAEVPLVEGTHKRAVTFSDVNEYILQATRPVLQKFTTSPTFTPEEVDTFELSDFSRPRPSLNRQKTTESMRQMKYAHLDTKKYPANVEKNVWYMNDEERQAFKLQCDETGHLVDAKGERLQPGLEYRYVTDKYRNFYASPASNTDNIQHSSYLAGEKTTSAGKLKILVSRKDPNKYLIFINNWSGHYKPDPELLEQTVDILVRMGVDRKLIKTQKFNNPENM